MTQFTLYSRSYCHLCDDMLAQLRTCMESDQEIKQRNLRFSIDVIDVDADEALIALYDELVPVLIGKKAEGKEVRICHYFLDVAKLKAFLHE
ncbi:MAG: glutaredoxin family protein [Undibacterium sp.]|nr:glutaredoxin family protein [Undibacterium sp.]MDO8702792.1 glutaredoxin family protein [Undibacterium sp.]